MNRVVITGMGALTPIGNDVKQFWDSAIQGKSGVRRISRFDAELFKMKIAAEIDNFQPAKYLDRNEIRRSDLFTQYALYAATEAIHDSGLDIGTMDPFQAGVIWGVGQGGMETFETEVKEFVAGNGIPRFNPFFVPRLIVNMAPGMISMKHGLQGINYATVSACATSNNAIMDAFNYIRWGKAKLMVTGGSEAPITPASLGGFSAMKAMSTRNDQPAVASRPYDQDRDGFVMGEGAGALILEEYQHALQRGAHIYAELAGAAMTADAYHMTAPHPAGIGAAKAMHLALEDAGINAGDVDYLNPHATSTPLGDLAELHAIQSVFGAAPRLQISATKSMTGHLLGAAGAIEAIICIKAIETGIIPPTINLDKPDPEIATGFRILRQNALEIPVKIALSNAFGFGGHNATIIFKQFAG